ncbi:MAG: ATP-dependent metallopeptidase FtsH/Yme1/Tma family protein [Clostridiales bacterium]|nr:ATP-dependent metallopeptidase FtsH/Yme1/Tma family protein [Clostridiales bacterium]
MKKNITQKSFLPYLILFCIIIFTVLVFNLGNTKVHVFTYDEFTKNMSKGKVDAISITPKKNDGVYLIEGKLKNYNEYESFKVYVPLSETSLSRILTYSENKGFEIVTNTNPENSIIVSMIANILPIVILAGITFYLFTKVTGGNNKSMDFGRSKAKLSEENGKVKFTDVAGLKEEKEEVAELIDFLKSPKKFQKLGARIPKGVLLVGPPGTGKTLLAKAIAGEANVPFYYISGSDFVELFVGVGASRVRDMFKQAKQTAPCLIFIDEIDAVGRQRGTGLGGGHDEREQTLNQLLTEMDGFGANEGIIIIAATNRPDVLDPALLRPGRFDRQVTVSLPDSREREAILEVHAKNKIFDKSVNLKNLAGRTPGFSGADLENLLNESALLAVRRNKNSISMDEIDEATDRVLLGPAKTSRKITEKEKKLVSIHESGHAVVGLKLPDANEVHKITIIPRGMAGGYTMMLPKEEKISIMTEKELLAGITGLLAGRVSEELFFGEITTGASDDFKRATATARAMVTEYGMSKLGPMQLESKSEGVFLGRDYTKSKNFSDQVALEIDKEVRRIIEECYEEAKKILKANEELVNLISSALIKYETLTKEQIDYIVATGKIDFKEELTVDELREIAKSKKIKDYLKMSEEELRKELDVD